MNDRISVAARISASQSEVTKKKCFILFPQMKMKLALNIASGILFEGKHFMWNVLECLGFRYFILFVTLLVKSNKDSIILPQTPTILGSLSYSKRYRMLMFVPSKPFTPSLVRPEPSRATFKCQI